MDSQSESSRGRGKNKHVWTLEEDKLLVDILLEFVVSGKHKSENGFRPGTFRQIETEFEARLPGCGIRANPHIESRVKTLKSKYNAIHDMINFGSGFGWDSEKKMVICERETYDLWANSHPSASGLFQKAFPHFDDLGTIFGKDRANGKGAFAPADLAEEVDLEDDANTDHGIDFVAPDESTTQRASTAPSEGDSIRSHKKRKRSVDDEFDMKFSNMMEVMTETAQSVNKLISSFSESSVDPLRKVFDEVAKISGLKEDDVLEASQIIMGDPIKVNLLFSMPDSLKKKWVDKLLRLA